MFSDRDETSMSIAAVSALMVACSMLAVQQEKALSPVRRHVHGTTRLPHDGYWLSFSQKSAFAIAMTFSAVIIFNMSKSASRPH